MTAKYMNKIYDHSGYNLWEKNKGKKFNINLMSKLNARNSRYDNLGTGADDITVGVEKLTAPQF